MSKNDNNNKDVKTITTMPMGTGSSFVLQKAPEKPEPHVHGPECGCGFPLADDGDEFEDED